MATDETRARIIEVAGPIFAEKGFRDATVREICAAADVGLASVNYHFRDKQQLYVHVVESAFDDLERHRPPLREWPAGTPVETRLQESIEWLAHKVLASPKDSWPNRLLTREIQAPTPACEGVLRRRIDADLAPLNAILADVLPAEEGTAQCHQLVLSIIGQILIYDSHRDLVRLVRADESESEVFQPSKIARHVTRVSLAALGLTVPIGCPRRGGQT
ncbi:MAG TPA: TetR/AcrR family transcriptional regulator [Phycisphaerae bacterium]|nr:TetR/AcrR family transcriptional regulator [Phycisphaerae bacterium]